VCRVAHQQFPDEPLAASQARGFVARTLTEWELPALVPDAQLAVSELVTNAILHARTPIVVTVAVSEGSLELAVTDHDLSTPQLRPQRRDLLADLDAIPPGGEDHPDPRHEGLRYGPAGSVAAGRGLIILDAIAESWGVTRHVSSKDVWARLPVPSDWPHLGSCGCGEQGAMGRSR
jgi:anti-sigma regulatory factor (Ser/Thr protein kinase)